MSGMLTGAARLPAAGLDLDRRFVDVSYLDLVANPVRAAADIYTQLGWTLDEQARARMDPLALTRGR